MFRSLFPRPTADLAQVEAMLTFVRDIGLVVREAPVPRTTFLPGLLLEAGTLVVDRRRLRYPGDILHEAGHLAVTAAAERPTVGGNVTANNPAKEGEELAVLAWSYAAAHALGLAAEVVFHPAGYKGQSEWLIHSFETGAGIGLPLLVWMGLTTNADFPRMTRWLRE